ncbi:MAG TPA: sigma-54 dependent transcriptional regulator [Polyangiaceae bacterium]|jgi:DNA-binding NtrC family response regulator|nr:sigma-54 dependent transcriptional regulator [Polyangiaceae bacterium]
MAEGSKKHVMIVDDDPCLCAVLDAELAKRDYRATIAQSPTEALAVLETGADDVDVILTDFQMQGASGADLCAQIGESDRFIPVVVMTSFGSMDTAVAAIRAGAYDYVTKPLDMDDLTLTLERGIKERALRAEVRNLRLGLESAPPFEEMVGTSPQMTKAFDLIERVATSDTTVLITGESGTGKELVARAIHSRSARSAGPFIAVNCAAMPEQLLESELFGHVKGAFTDARQTRLGLFLKASGGTLFLDEIGEMPAGMQAKLLRSLQERTVRAVGGDTEIPFDTRILAATNRDLEHEVAEKRFREDLFYRINVVNIEVPALRERGRDILTLANHMLRRAQPNERRVVGFTVGAADALLAHSWPGNVRELQNCIERAVALAEFDHIRVEDLPESVTQRRAVVSGVEGHDPRELITAAELQHRYVAQVMAAVKGNKTLAARILGCDRRTVSRQVRTASAS